MLLCSDYVTVKCGGESEIDVELEEDGSLALSSLKALYSNATGLFFSSESGRRRGVRVVDNKCFPPQEKWGERVYKVVVPETDVNEATPASTSANICVSTSVPNPLFTAVSNISATGGSSVVSRTKQSTLLLEGNGLKLGPELNVSCRRLNHNLVQGCGLHKRTFNTKRL